MEITLQSNRTILNTAGKYCAEDIVVSASLQDKTVTPTASTQTISADTNHVGLGTVTVLAGLDTSDATATSTSLLSGETAYVNGQRITGTIPTYSGSLREA